MRTYINLFEETEPNQFKWPPISPKRAQQAIAKWLSSTASPASASPADYLTNEEQDAVRAWFMRNGKGGDTFNSVLRKIANYKPKVDVVVHPYYPAQLCPLGVTLADGSVVESVFQNMSKVEIYVSKNGVDKTLHYAFDQCVYTIPSKGKS